MAGSCGLFPSRLVFLLLYLFESWFRRDEYNGVYSDRHLFLLFHSLRDSAKSLMPCSAAPQRTASFYQRFQSECLPAISLHQVRRLDAGGADSCAPQMELLGELGHVVFSFIEFSETGWILQGNEAQLGIWVTSLQFWIPQTWQKHPLPRPTSLVIFLKKMMGIWTSCFCDPPHLSKIRLTVTKNQVQCITVFKDRVSLEVVFLSFFLGGGGNCMFISSFTSLSQFISFEMLIKRQAVFLTRFYSLCCYFTFIVKDSNVIVFTQSVVFLNKQLLHRDSCLPIFKNEQEFSFAFGYRGQAHTDVRSAPAHVMWPI